MSEIAERLARAAPAGTRPLAGLVARLAADGHLLEVGSAGAVEIGGVAYDSRAAGPGSLFVAVPGVHADGHAFVESAAAAGAAAAIVERSVPGVRVPQIVVRDARRALASAAAWWFGDPSHELAVVGITGTDGKTTTSFLAVAALEAAGIPTGLVGTVETKIGGVRESNLAHATTPEAPQLQAALRAMVQAGDRAAIVETTSHGLALRRVDEIAYDIAILTNLTHEHLELHGTFAAYRAAKVSLFERLGGGAGGQPGGRPPEKAGVRAAPTAIVNVDDPAADRFRAAAHAAGARIIGYGAGADADVRFEAIEVTPPGLTIRYQAPSGRGEARVALEGRFNAWNALAVVALGEALGLDPGAVVAGLAAVDRVPGRMERIAAGQPFTVVVDYAHSPASLAAVLDDLADEATARGGGLIAVFGSAGERDRAKRPRMGRIAGERCRLVIVTDEDPRGEDRRAILEEIAAGAEAAGKRRGDDLLVVADRSEAIAAAFDRAQPGDIVLLAGKGHETSIIGPDGERPWDEAGEARRALAARGFRA